MKRILVRSTVLVSVAFALNFCCGQNTGAQHQDAEVISATEQCRLGLGYAKAGNHIEAAKCFRKSAEQGVAAAQYNLGIAYLDGHGVPQDYTEAARWWRKASEQGYVNAQCNLGMLYHNGQGVPKDYVESLKWFKIAAATGDKKSVELRDKLMRGMTSEQIAEGQRRVTEFVSKKSPDRVLNATQEGLNPHELSVSKLLIAAEQGDAESQVNLGAMYQLGWRVPQNYTEALKWYLKAAEQGRAIAQNNLGVIYREGYGVPQNSAVAVKWFRKAAEQGLAAAQHSLGTAYENGLGVPQDFVEAYKWFNLAAASGHKESVKFRENILRRMTPEQIAEGQKRTAEVVPIKKSVNE